MQKLENITDIYNRNSTERKEIQEIRQIFTEELLSRFAAYLQVSDESLRAYGAALRKFYDFLSENSIWKPDRYNIYDYINTLRQSGMSQATVQLYVTALRLFFGWTAVENIYPDIMQHIKSGKKTPGHKRDYLSPDQLRRIEQVSFSAHGTECEKRDRAIFHLMVQTGLRTIEVVRADIGDFRFQGSKTVLYIQGKGRADKEYVPIGDNTAAILREYINSRTVKRADDALFASCSNRNTRPDRRMTTQSVRKIIKDGFEKAGFSSPRLTAHSLRHSAVTNALLSGVSIRTVRQFVRHRSISTTELYAHDLDMLNNETAQVLDDIL